MKPLVYIAGPYSKPDPVENTALALRVATSLLDGGLCTPVVPHLTMFWHFAHPHPYEDWLAYDLEVLSRCDALYRLAGESSGADREVNFANNNGIRVFSSRGTLEVWLHALSPNKELDSLGG